MLRNSGARVTCLINSFNYRSYVVEAVESALGQTRPFDQILVVDDGSSDGTVDALQEQFGHEPLVQIVGKENGGQLSCFNFAMPLVTGDLLFFLDADDRYRLSYLAEALDCYERTAADFLIVGLQNFGADDRLYSSCKGEQDFGLSVMTTLWAGTWIGGPTSCLSMKTSLARRLLPYPFEPQWRIQADNVLVYGASLLGAHKYQLGASLVERRVHGTNLFYGRGSDPLKLMRFQLERNRMFAWYIQKAGYNVADLPRLLPMEFRTLQRPTFKDYRRYVRLSWNSPLSFVNRIKQFLTLTRRMLLSKSNRPTAIHTSKKILPRP